MKTHTALIVSIIGVVAFFANNQVQSVESEDDKQFYCGRRLARTLAMICVNGLLVKRSDPVYNYMLGHEHEGRTLGGGQMEIPSRPLPDVLGALYPLQATGSLGPKSMQQYDWPWVPPHRARSMERGKRQAAAECCDKPCTLPELFGYCAPGP